ncbi:MAG: transposase domain-containing protein [Oligosphaeraceae bacterium]
MNSQKEGASLAFLAGFAATGKENAVDFEKWLLDVMERLDTTPAEDIDCLLPHLWKKDREKT